MLAVFLWWSGGILARAIGIMIWWWAIAIWLLFRPTFTLHVRIGDVGIFTTVLSCRRHEARSQPKCWYPEGPLNFLYFIFWVNPGRQWADSIMGVASFLLNPEIPWHGPLGSLHRIYINLHIWNIQSDFRFTSSDRSSCSDDVTLAFLA